MNYEMESLASTLKHAREAKQLSQRELSKRTGVPQSHISKIEKSGVDLRVSSLSAIANALDLELALVPRKAVPAVKSISRTAGPTQAISKEIVRAMTQIADQIDRVGELDVDPQTYEELQRNYRELKHIQVLIPDILRLSQFNQLINDILRHGELSKVKTAARELARVRNELVHSPDTKRDVEHFRPKYQLDGDDDG